MWSLPLVIWSLKEYRFTHTLSMFTIPSQALKHLHNKRSWKNEWLQPKVKFLLDFLLSFKCQHMLAQTSHNLFLLFLTIAATVDTASSPYIFENAIPNRPQYGARKRRHAQMSGGTITSVVKLQVDLSYCLLISLHSHHCRWNGGHDLGEKHPSPLRSRQ